jgi:hypothetical protein
MNRSTGEAAGRRALPHLHFVNRKERKEGALSPKHFVTFAKSFPLRFDEPLALILA